MPNPFTEEPYPDEEEQELVERAREGDRVAFERLVRAHQAWIYNIAVRMLHDPDEAADATMEALLKAITRLSTFRGDSTFRTWLYRIVVNHVLNVKKGKVESTVTTFTDLGMTLEQVEDAGLTERHSVPADRDLLVEEAKISCMTGMLLCLDREQRLVYVLGEVFGVTDRVGAELLELSPANFRQRLARARRDLHSFMNDRCGLINKSNPCRCARKTRGFIDMGFVDPRNLQFACRHLETVSQVSSRRIRQYGDKLEPRYADLYREHPFQEPPDYVAALERMLGERDFTELFDLN
jgi:RNA polymerase sigma factor (sigma-70 family)